MTYPFPPNRQCHSFLTPLFHPDLVKLFGEEKVRQVVDKLSLFVFSGTNENPTAAFAHWVLPTAAYVEKDGTFLNCHGQLQRIGRAFAPLAGSREDWSILLELAEKLGQPFDWQEPEQIFSGLAGTLEALEGLDYKALGSQGVQVQVEGTALS